MAALERLLDIGCLVGLSHHLTALERLLDIGVTGLLHGLGHDILLHGLGERRLVGGDLVEGDPIGD